MILFETQQNIYMETCSKFFYWFYEKCVANRGIWLVFFMYAENFDISTCSVVTCQNIMLHGSTIIAYKNVQEITLVN